MSRPEWADVALHTDLRLHAERLLEISEQLQQLARSWHPSARERITLQAAEIRDWAELALIARDTGDTWSRLDSLQLAHARLRAAEQLLARWRHDTRAYHTTQPAATVARARTNGA